MLNILISLLACATSSATSPSPMMLLGPVPYAEHSTAGADSPVWFEQRLGHLGARDVATFLVQGRHGDFLANKMAKRLFDASLMEIKSQFNQTGVRLVGIALEDIPAELTRGQRRPKGARGFEDAYANFARDLVVQNPGCLFIMVAPAAGNLRQNVLDVFAEANLPNVIVTAVEHPTRLPGVDSDVPAEVLLNASKHLLTTMHNAPVKVIRDQLLRDYAFASKAPCNDDLDDVRPVWATPLPYR